ncbi:hypothetical protein IWQ55_000440 [Labrenzia sp. EL_208]|nr:hypothetical protein [Labrenzia sp. EL_132]MBG6227248.1 hypothetical protein [Labrenzia sp. EL_208]
MHDKTGMRAEIDMVTQHLVGDFMTDQHRDSFEESEYTFPGTIEQAGPPHASILTGSLGFTSSSNPKMLAVETGESIGLPAFDRLSVGQRAGV